MAAVTANLTLPKLLLDMYEQGSPARYEEQQKNTFKIQFQIVENR